MKMFDPMGMPVFMATSSSTLTGDITGDQGDPIDTGGYKPTGETVEVDGVSYPVFVDDDGNYWIQLDGEWTDIEFP